MGERRRREAEAAQSVEWETGGQARRRASTPLAEPLANRGGITGVGAAAQRSPRRSRAWVARCLVGKARGRDPGDGPGAEQPREPGSPSQQPSAYRLRKRPQQGCPTAPPARPGSHRRGARRLLAAAARRPRPLRVPAPSAAAAASRLRLLLLREPPPSPPPSLLPPAGAQPAPAAPESSRSRSRCLRPRHERKRRRRCRRRRCFSSRGRRALPASVVVSQAGPRGARAPAPPAPPTAAAPARVRRCRPPQPAGPRASPGGRPGWRRLRPSAGSRYGVQEPARRGGAWVGLWGEGLKGVWSSPPAPRSGWSMARVSFVRPLSPWEPCVPRRAAHKAFSHPAWSSHP